MAGEVLGKTYEALTRIAIRLAGIPDKQVFWDEQPKAMSIKPDFVVGRSLDEPSKVILCAHSHSSKETEKKFWRNLEELFETKGAFARPLDVYNFIFNPSYKGKLRKIMVTVFDATLEVSSRPYGKRLLASAARLAKKEFRAIGADGMIRLIEKYMDPKSKDYDADLTAAINSLGDDVRETLRKRSTDYATLWPLIRKQYKRKTAAAKARPTYVKRGIGKLILFTPKERAGIYANLRDGKELPAMPAFAAALGLTSEVLTGDELIDTDIGSVVRMLRPAEIEAVIGRSPSKAMAMYITPLRNISNLRAYHDFVLEHRSELNTPDGMARALRQCFADPSRSLPPGKVKGVIDRVWLLEYAFSLLKALSGMKQGYGYSQLEQTLRIDDPASIRFWAPEFVARRKMPSDERLNELARCLSVRLAEYSEDQIDKAFRDTVASEKVSLLEDKLLPYRNFEPLGVLVRSALDAGRIKYTVVKSHPTCLSEYASVSAATTLVVTSNHPRSALIKWQSAYDKGKGHKRKELSARCTAMRYTWHEQAKRFAPREYEKYIFVIDGTWDDDDLKILLRGGWDEVYYADEMAKLVKSLSEKKTVIPFPAEDALPMAAEPKGEPMKIGRRGE